MTSNPSLESGSYDIFHWMRDHSDSHRLRMRHPTNDDFSAMGGSTNVFAEIYGMVTYERDQFQRQLADVKRKHHLQIAKSQKLQDCLKDSYQLLIDLRLTMDPQVNKKNVVADRIEKLLMELEHWSDLRENADIERTHAWINEEGQLLKEAMTRALQAAQTSATIIEVQVADPTVQTQTLMMGQVEQQQTGGGDLDVSLPEPSPTTPNSRQKRKQIFSLRKGSGIMKRGGDESGQSPVSRKNQRIVQRKIELARSNSFLGSESMLAPPNDSPNRESLSSPSRRDYHSDSSSSTSVNNDDNFAEDLIRDFQISPHGAVGNDLPLCEESPISCICGRIFTNGRYLRQHVNYMKKRVSCSKCLKAFNSQAHLDSHHCKGSQNQRLLYDSCVSMEMDSYSGSGYHYPHDVDHVEEVSSSGHSDREIEIVSSRASIPESPRADARHGRCLVVDVEAPSTPDSPSGRIYLCKCGRTFTMKANLKEHIAHHETQDGILTGKLFRCEVCSGRFTKHRGLKTHMISIHPRVEYKCTVGCNTCGQTFENAAQLHYHKRRTHRQLVIDLANDEEDECNGQEQEEESIQMEEPVA